MVSRVDLLESLKKAEMLKEKPINGQNISNPDIWSTQQQLVNIYEEVLLLDLEYALDKKVEQDLWNFCFKNYIAVLQNSAKENKGGTASSKLAWFLECASGFYLSLLQEMCTVFKLDLPVRRSDGVFGVVGGRSRNIVAAAAVPKRSSCFYICQHCLVHLGDLARYRNYMAQAEAFYRQGVGLGAGSGHPYNQLALLARGDALSTVFYYIRSIAVSHRFPAAITNLRCTLAKTSQPNQNEAGTTKVGASEYEALFLRLIAVVYGRQDSEASEPLLQTLGPALTPLVATRNFSSFRLVQMAAIAIFVYSQAGEEADGRAAAIESCIAEYLAGFLTALLLPVYTLPSTALLDYFALPAIRCIAGWLECEKGAVERLGRRHLWRGLCKLLNDLRAARLSAPPPAHINDALPEDFDLRGFLPLDSVIGGLNFAGDEMDADCEKRLRAFRLVKAGEWLALQSDSKSIVINDCGLFEVASSPAPSVVVEKILPPPQPAGLGIVPITGRTSDQRGTRSTTPARHNVALQSILRLSGSPGDPSDWKRVPAVGSRWWPPRGEDTAGMWNNSASAEPALQSESGVYSLFSGGSEPSPTVTPQPAAHQSLWSGPGPSPLERLLEQQKSQRQSDAT